MQDLLGEVLQHMCSEQVAINMIGKDGAARHKADGHLKHWMQEAEAFDRYRVSIL